MHESGSEVVECCVLDDFEQSAEHFSQGSACSEAGG